MPVPNRQIPPERKRLYYIGQIVSGIGLLSFLSVFVTSILNMGNFDHFDGQMKSSGIRAFGGIIAMILGGAISNIAARGLAGSGVILDPEQARKDIEPWSRLGGGVIQDTISEIEVVNQLSEKLATPAAQPEVKVRCTKCRALNSESAKFCDQCGESL